MMLRDGRVCRPGPDGPVAARTADGGYLDPFDVVDRLTADYSLLYLVDLDGIERQDPQLDYIQELSRDLPLWVDAGTRVADQAIDIIVAGARRAVLSTAYLRGRRELTRAWKLTTELAFEAEFRNGRLAPTDPSWNTNDVYELLGAVRAVGIDHFVVSPRESDPDWELVRRVAAIGPTWVDGTFQASDAARLAEVGASGGIFHPEALYDSLSTASR